MKRIVMTLFALMLMPFMALATTWYVDGTNGSDSYSGKNQSAAKKTIQSAIDVSSDGDTILVAPGTYAPIVTENKAIVIKSQHGANGTIIDAGDAKRCAVLASGSDSRWETARWNTHLVGFTLTGGHDTSSGATGDGAAVCAGTIIDCIIKNCVAERSIVFACDLYGCLIVRNDAKSGYGVLMHGWAHNCTIANNFGRVAWDAGLENCIAVNGSIYKSYGEPEGCHYCCLDFERAPEQGNFVATPKFVDAANGDYRLAAGSPCVDVGNNSYVSSDTDLDGNARIINGIVDIGCYEYDAGPATWYVDGTNGSDSYSGKSQSVAKKTIQAAIDASSDGDMILVAAGVYDSIETGYKSIRIVGIEGAGQTVIDGQNVKKCVDLGGNAHEGEKHGCLVGFTLRNGCVNERRAGSAAVSGGELDRCVVTKCKGLEHIVFACRASNCLIANNQSEWAILMHGYAYNCTVVDNDASDCAWDNALDNSIVRGNKGGVYISSGNSESYCYNSIFDKSLPTGSGNFVADPKFVDAANGDYRLAAGSPCVDAGNNLYVNGETDLDGKARIVNGTVDIGCYEYVGGVDPIVYRTVTFDANGGVASAVSRSVKNGAAVGELPTATRAGYDFLGWFTSANGGTKVSEATVVAADVTWYAHWQEQVVEPTIFTVQFNANGGTCTKTSVEVEEGASVGTLPTARRTGYDFLGWFTLPNGGTQVSASTVVTEDATWYAHWQEQSEDPIVPPVDPGEDDEPMDASIANTYDGVIVDADGLPMGYITVKAAKASGKGDAKVSKVTATIQMVGETKKVTVKADVAVAEAAMTQAAADGRVLDLTFSRYGIWGTFDDYEIDGVRNLLASTASSDKGTDAKNAAEAACAALKGNYVMAYGDENGYNGLSVSIMAKGKVKVSGKLADGTTVSTTSQLIVGEDYSVIPVIYTKKDTSLAFNIYFTNDGSEAEVFGYYDAVISVASSLDEGLSFYAGESIYDLFEDCVLLDEFLPYEVSVEPKGKKWVVAGGAAAGKIKVVDGEAVDSKESDNPSGLKLTFNAKAGTFSGSFKVYALDSKDKLKTFTASVSGVVVDGLGYGVATIKGLGSIAVTIE